MLTTKDKDEVAAGIRRHQGPVAAASPVEQALHQVIAEQTRHGAKLDAILRALERAHLARDRDRRPTALSREDREILKRILPAVAGARGSERFTSRDLVEDDRPAVRLAVGQMTAKQIVKLFARADRIPIDGLMVQRDGVDFHVTAWRIVGRGSV